jgi:tetratricopeptide (TPR) repeat protein
MKSKRYLLAGVAAILILVAVLLLLFSTTGLEQTKETTGTAGEGTALATFAGRDSCINCHQKAYRLWKGSDHDLAMQPASEQTVLGNFNAATFTNYGITSRFYRKNSGFFVYTEGPEGKMMEFEVMYTFGVTPLQQYLVPLPGGRLQVLPLCWDTRPVSQGGQRWFHIYPDERIPPEDMLYWTRLSQNWNYMCADCHSTNLRKNYNAEKDSFATTYSEVDVSCEACHGPGSAHIAWAKAREQGEETGESEHAGFTIRFPGRDEVTWVFSDTSATAHRTTPKKDDLLIEMCARCHTRRSQLTDEHVAGEHFLNAYRPALLVDGLYFPDGQILEEVYVWGSFLQSKMYQQGVVCNDCHDSHSMRVYAQDNTLCYRCHQYDTYGVREHHFHNPDSTGASCMECHMPERTYMVIDPRRDHSIRIPRPDLTMELGTPNACNKCHKDRDAGWALTAMRKWYGTGFQEKSHYGQIFAAARQGSARASEGLQQLLGDPHKPDIVRATAAVELANYLNQESSRLLLESVKDKNPLMRYAALNALAQSPADVRLAAARGLLDDPVLLVRSEAARLLIGIQTQTLTSDEQNAFRTASREYLAIQRFNADQPAANLNLGVYYINQGNYREAEKAYLRAIDQEPGLAYAYINLADLYRLQDRDADGASLLKKAISRINDNAELYYALALTSIRQKQTNEAVASLEQAIRLDPENAHMQYALALAYDAAGNRDKAIGTLLQGRKRFPDNANILYALATFYRDQGDLAPALENARRLYQTDPANQNYRQLLGQIEAMIKEERP